MSLGLKEVLSINTDFVSKKDEKLTGNDKSFSEMNDSEIKKAAKALVEQEIASLGLSKVEKVEDLSKEAQTIFSDIVAWMLERKMRDHDGDIATDNENAEFRESVAELTASVASIFRSFEPFFQNKEHRTEYRKRFLDEKIKEKENLLQKYAQTELPPLKGAEQDESKIKMDIISLEKLTKENDDKLEKYGQDLKFLESVKKEFDSLIKELKEILENDSQAKTSKEAKYKAFETLLQNNSTDHSGSINLQFFIRNCLTKSQEMKEQDCSKSNICKDIEKLKSQLEDYTAFKTDFKNEKDKLIIEPAKFTGWEKSLKAINDDNTDIITKLSKLKTECTECNELILKTEKLKSFESEFIEQFGNELINKDKIDDLKDFEILIYYGIEHLNGLKGDGVDKLKEMICSNEQEKKIWSSDQIRDHYKRSSLLKIVKDSNKSESTSITDDLTVIRLMFPIIKSSFETIKEEQKEEQKEILEQSIELLKASVTKQVDETLEKLQEENEKLVTENESKTKQIEGLQQATGSIIDESDLKIRKSESDLNTITDDQKKGELPKLKRDLTELQDTIQDIKDLEGKLPWTTKILPGSSGSNTIYKIEYILGGGEPPIVIEEFSFPTQKSVRSRNAAVAKRLILLLLAQKPVEDDKVFEAQEAVEKAEKELEEAENESNVQSGQQPSETSKKDKAKQELKTAENKLKEAKGKAKENEESLKNKLYKNAPNLAEVAKQSAFFAKTIVRFRQVSLAQTNGVMKRKFNRAADCYGAIPVILRATLASLEAGFSFNGDKQRQRI